MTTEEQGRTPKYSSTDSSIEAPKVKKGERKGPKAPARGFTESTIAALPHGPKRYEVFDSRRNGLCIRVAAVPGKSKAWVWYAVDENGKRRNITLGRWPKVSVEAARDLLEEMKKSKMEGQLAATLSPPAPAEKPVLVRDLAETFFKVKIEGKRRHSWHARSILDNYILPTIGDCEAADLTTQIMMRPAEAAVEKGARVHAAAVLAVTKALSRFAAVRGDIPVDCAAALRPGDVDATTDSGRKRRVEDAELPLLLAGLNQLTDPTRTLLHLLLTTGVRTGELLGAPWSEFDLEAGVWTIPPERQKLTLEKMKGAEPWRVPLAPRAVALLERLKKLPKKKSKWVAASEDAEVGHLTDKVLSHAMRRLQGQDTPTKKRAAARALARAQGAGGRPGPAPGRAAPRMVLPGGPIRAHDFRRALRGWLQRKRCPLDVAEQTLGHSLAKLGGVIGVYAQDDIFDSRKEWMARWAAHLDALEATGAAE